MKTDRSFGGAPSWRRTALALALGLSLSGVAVAQSNSSGSIYGRVDSTVGSTVHIESPQTGFTRDVPVDADGRYRIPSLPVGNYKVSVMRDGATTQSRDVVVLLGSGTDVSFTPAAERAEARELEGVTVTGASLPAIDVSATDSRTVFTSQQLQKLPIARDVTAVALLAPGAVGGDSRYGNVPSFGGASAAENQYYVNGFPTTNALTGVGFASLPYDAISQQQIYTGGYGAEYGRSTGGVINVITKSGTNDFHTGGQIVYIPQALRQAPRNIYLRNGTPYQYRAGNTDNSTEYSAYVSGPLIKDKLFFYLTGDFIRRTGKTNGSVATSTTTNWDQKTTRWLAKLDWNITDDHHLEYTGFSDKLQENDQIYAYPYASGASRGTKGDYLGTVNLKNQATANSAPGGDFNIFKYTGYLTDSLTLNAVYGKSKTEHVQSPSGLGGACPIVSGNYTNAAGVTVFPPACYLIGSIIPPGAEDKTRATRLDLEWQIGDHAIRGGIDNQTLENYNGSSYEANQRYIYANVPASGQIPNRGITFPAGTRGYVDYRVFLAAAHVKVKQEAQFLEDRWQITDRWLASIGLRNEQFSNYNGDGDVYVKQRHQLAPRLGLSWDVFGDSSLKIYGNAGRYHLAVPSNVAIRGASGQLYTSQYGTFTGINPDGSPAGFTPIGPLTYLNGADGTAPDPKTVAAKGLSAYYQDEYILGFDKQLGDAWTGGAKVTYRKLKSIIDDFCDARPFEQWEAANGVALDPSAITGCFLFNPGKSNTFMVPRADGSGLQEVNISKEGFRSPEGVNFPDLKRGYYALNLYLEHAFANNWYGKIDYVFSRSYGNSEGLLKSDIGQLDPSVTQDWDAPEIMVGANGPLPNDRKHQLKAYGYYQITPEWMVSGTVQVLSGRPVNCIGWNPADPIDYGASYFYCDGKVAPRGSRGRTPWTKQLNLGAEYRPKWADYKLAFQADVFNVLGGQETLSFIETGEQTGGAPNPQYKRSISYQTPRYFRFALRYDL